MNAIFTFGFERSGTTLLSMLLGAHPELAVPFSPTGLWYRYNRRLDGYGSLRNDADREELVRDLLAEERIQLWDVDPDPDEILRYAENGEYRDIIAAFHRNYADAHQKPCWALHDIATISQMHIAKDWFPEARFLHIVRDVRDVVLSHKSYRYGSSNACEVALSWQHAVGRNVQIGRVLGPDQYQIVKYEDLIKSPEQTLQEICQFLGLTFDSQMLSYADEVERKVPTDKRVLWPALGGELDSSRIGRWRDGLRNYETSAIMEIASDTMLECGYAPERAPTSILKEAYLIGCMLTRGGRIQRLQRRFNRMLGRSED